jgi:hypothetical protein
LIRLTWFAINTVVWLFLQLKASDIMKTARICYEPVFGTSAFIGSLWYRGKLLTSTNYGLTKDDAIGLLCLRALHRGFDMVIVENEKPRLLKNLTALDVRFSISKEHCGRTCPDHVLRFMGEFVGAFLYAELAYLAGKQYKATVLGIK